MKEPARTMAKQLAAKAVAPLVDDVANRLSNSNDLADAIAHRISLEALLREDLVGQPLVDVFKNCSDPFWFWLCTEGYRRSAVIRRLLPAMPDEDVQMQFTGNSGDAVLREAFSAYILFRETYEAQVGPIEECPGILDFGCGWGRFLRFFLKDTDPSRLWGADPVEEMITLCKRSLWQCSFERIDTQPPTPFPDEEFGLIYAYSVFSHLSEEMHKRSLAELTRILRPGGLLIVTTRPRDFILNCAALRKNPRLESIHPGPGISASAYLDTESSLRDYDRGAYCFSQLVFEGDWSYWGEAAIPKDYVLRNWSEHLTVLDYIDDRRRCAQNVIVLRKPS